MATQNPDPVTLLELWAAGLRLGLDQVPRPCPKGDGRKLGNFFLPYLWGIGPKSEYALQCWTVGDMGGLFLQLS
jgi:hypothetical protein